MTVHKNGGEKIRRQWKCVVTSVTTSPGFGRLSRTVVRRAASAQWLDLCDVTGVSLCMHMGQWPLVHRHCPNLHGGCSPRGIISQTTLRAVGTCLAITGSFVDKSRGQKIEKQLMVSAQKESKSKSNKTSWLESHKHVCPLLDAYF